MYIKKLCLIHFRNYSTQTIEFSPELTFFYGQNAQGKTNILEAIFLLSTVRSPRTNKLQETVAWGEPETILEGIFQTRTKEKRVALQIKKNGEKIIRLDNRYLKKTSELLGQIPVVFFSPDDLDVIKKAPQGRRRFMDLLFSQTSRKYTHQLLEYTKILKQRNECLKQIAENKAKPRVLDVWDEGLVDAGLALTRLRTAGLQALLPEAERIYREITEGTEELKIKYLSSMGEDKIKVMEKIKQHRQNELATQQTCLGPQRDDLLVLIEQHSAKNFASHGQQRTAMISLKLAELKYFERVFQERPIVLLDDILLELDAQRFSVLIKSLFQKTQTIMTGTEQRRARRPGQEVQFYEVESGNVRKKNTVASN